LLARGEAQVLRIALTYRGLAQSPHIEAQHLTAGLALWEYSEASVEYVFGDRLGDPDADAILSALRTSPNGLTRTEISNLFNRNRSAAQIQRALTSLAQKQLITAIVMPTDGRPVERWFAAHTKRGAN